MQTYGPLSYFTLGRVYPRETLRQGYPRSAAPRTIAALNVRTPIDFRKVFLKQLRGGFYGRFY